jgi:hypothetical protein
MIRTLDKYNIATSIIAIIILILNLTWHGFGLSIGLMGDTIIILLFAYNMYLMNNKIMENNDEKKLWNYIVLNYPEIFNKFKNELKRGKR